MSIIRYQVFVSSTYRDLKETRQRVIEALMSINAIPAGMELFPSADEDAWSIIKQSIDLSDYYVVIIGGKYGSVNPETGLSYTEMEYDYAAEKGVPIMAFIHENPNELKAKDVESDVAAREKLEAFKSKAMQKHCKFWNEEKDLIPNVLASFTRMCSGKPGVGWIRGNEAKTIEDVEHMAALERRVRELENEITGLNASSTEFDTIIQECNQTISFPLHAEDEHECQLSIHYFVLFRAVGYWILDGGHSTCINDELYNSLQANLHFFKLDCAVEKHYIEIPKAEIEKFGKFLALRGLIRIEKVFVQYDEDDRYHGEWQSKWIIQDKGKDFLLYSERKIKESDGIN